MKLNSVYFNMLRAKTKVDCPTTKTLCTHTGCLEEGIFRAPHKNSTKKKKSTDKKDWLYFCSNHIGTYNQSYDFFANMSPEQIIAFIQKNDVGHRPTWRLGHGAAKRFSSAKAFTDSFYFFHKERAKKQAHAGATPPTQKKVSALQILGLGEKANGDEIKSRFKALVKQYHPDLNGGERKYEHRLSAVIKSYNELKGRP